MSNPIIIMSVGGSLMVPEEIDIEFLKNFKSLILKHLHNKRFALITGGGKICRKYQEAANKLCQINNEDMDWLGIHVTRLNAHLMRTIFKNEAHEVVIKNPTKNIGFNEKILIGAGWKPGCSTDYDAVLLAKNLNAKRIINLTNTDFVYDKDPKIHKDAKILKELSWEKMQELVGTGWSAGLNMPFDPIATKLARELNLEVIIANGKNLENLDNILNNKEFIGTLIH